MKKEGYSLRKRILYGFLSVCLVSIGGAFVLSYFFLRDNAITQSKTDQQKKVEGLMVALDYAVSHTSVETKDLKEILGNRIYEITDVNKLDAVVYDLQGNYILSNKDIPNAEQKLPIHLIAKVLGGNTRVDITTYAEDIDANLISSYLLLKNNELEPIGIVYVPYYHNDSVYFGVFKTYINHIIIINIIVILIAAFLSWVISKNLTKHLQEFSKLIDNLTLFEKNLKPIRHYENDELSVLAKSYNRLVYQILDQKEKLSFAEKEKAWQEMAKQVAHEVKNPLTPMKLTI
ncbi:MAG: two-component sensor histidine kinase, partial [Bergeyella zoohelcum]|nr:two-component sensor histidine kinase [Bergeyella zoohelcum]